MQVFSFYFQNQDETNVLNSSGKTTNITLRELWKLFNKNCVSTLRLKKTFSQFMIILPREIKIIIHESIFL